ncbi:GPW/gp25 family protein [Streptomyces cinnabarinus]|uniref:GPW/gp25 family protein n=1 Tax=Streptomyces cinnabarinus TaxID=67287 RepID=A0ABY7K7B2_9ACTN|nr:GPW/gp25 family protein [Streptomyces cinnabarinus]WAZ20018.1 GPW/gp25 family protein [Streptomyces cinnabarinus]
MTVLNVDFPFRFDGRGRTATADHAAHVQNLVEQVLFTTPGERVNRPDFGCGLLDLVFEPAGPEMVATVEMTAQAALQRWLGDLLTIERLEVTVEEATLSVSLSYRLIATGDQHSVRIDGGTAR